MLKDVTSKDVRQKDERTFEVAIGEGTDLHIYVIVGF